MQAKPSALAQALKYLARREHYRKELKQKLKAWPAQEVDDALDQLQQDGHLSDHRYIEAYIHQQRRKLYGPQWITLQLKHKGFDEGEIRQALDGDAADWRENLRRCYDKKCAGKAPADGKEKARMKNYLYRRGYPLDQINSLLREL